MQHAHLEKGVQVARSSLVVKPDEPALRPAQRLILPLKKNMKTYHNIHEKTERERKRGGGRKELLVQQEEHAC